MLTSAPIDSYALIGDTGTAALVGSDGSIDWLCLPRFDSPAVFAALLGDPSHGRWRIGPSAPVTSTSRRYLDDTLVLETELTTAEGTVRILDCMPPIDGDGTEGGRASVVRVVEGVSGRVPMRNELVLRFDYGQRVPWVRRTDGGIHAVAGPDAVTVSTPVELRGEGMTTVAEFEVGPGDRVPFVLTHHRSWQAEPPPPPLDAEAELERAVRWWRAWSDRGSWAGAWRDDVRASARVLKALSHHATGGIVAAPTTSLPEAIGGVRNWDYRYVWLRDATFTLTALLAAGHEAEARAWRDWLLRAVAGDPREVQVLYGIGGETRVPESELDWLPGYADSRPVRVGNGAAGQLQLDVYGEVLDALDESELQGLTDEEHSWDLQRVLLDHLEGAWDDPDHGIWEIRGDPQHLVHSKVMAWVAFDRAVRCAERGGRDGPVDRWRRLRQAIHDEVTMRGWDDEAGTFTQSYGSDEVDAALLLLPQVGFLPGHDERIRGTVRAIEERLVTDDVFVARYETASGVDGLPGHEGSFLLCSFWLVDALELTGRGDEARARFERLLGLRNDVGLLAEEIDPSTGTMLGNFPQAFSHIGLVNSAANLCEDVRSPAVTRGSDDERVHRDRT